MKKKETKSVKITDVKMKELEKKLKELKIELLKQPLKRKKIKTEIARVLTQISNSRNNLIKSEENK